MSVMKRKISLDFTSLLDITMIILFFFLINFKFSVDGIKAEAGQQMEAAAAQSERLENDKQKFEEEKEDWQKQAEAELKKIREADGKAADNAEALIKYANGDVINIDLDIKTKSNWKITVSRGEAVLGVISPSDNKGEKDTKTYVNEEIVRLLNRERFSKDDVIIGIFKYNKLNYGSRFAENIFKDIKEVEYNFTNFYLAKSAYSVKEVI